VLQAVVVHDSKLDDTIVERKGAGAGIFAELYNSMAGATVVE